MRVLFFAVFLCSCEAELAKEIGRPLVMPAADPTPVAVAEPIPVPPIEATPVPPIEATPIPSRCDGLPLPAPGVPPPDREAFLNFHNAKRCWHDAPLMTWSDELAEDAGAYASQCRFAHDETVMGRQGENLAIGYPSPIQAQITWYRESEFYDYETGVFSAGIGHFTQMIWVGSTELGCARVMCDEGPFDVCRYRAAGNVLGRFKENVRPLRFEW